MDHILNLRSEDEVSEMDIDHRVQSHLDQSLGRMDEELIEEVSEEEEEEEEDEEDWLRMTDDEVLRCREELEHVRATFVDDVDMMDTTMVAEYADEIFGHMEEMEITTLPNPRYMDFQTEIEW
jgi:G2/mitotic-specific cyclin 1/2